MMPTNDLFLFPDVSAKTGLSISPKGVNLPEMPSSILGKFVLTLPALQTKTGTSQTVAPDETAQMSRLIWIYTVCYSIFYFRLEPLFALMDMSIFKD